MDNWTEQECLEKLKENPNDIYALYRMANICFINQNLEKAQDYLKTLHEVQPDFKPEKVNESLGEIYERQKNYPKALDHFKKLYKVVNNK